MCNSHRSPTVKQLLTVMSAMKSTKLMALIWLKPVGVEGTGGCAVIVVPTIGGNVVPGTEGAGVPDVTPGGTVGLTPAKRDICTLVCCSITSIKAFLVVFTCTLSK